MHAFRACALHMLYMLFILIYSSLLLAAKLIYFLEFLNGLFETKMLTAVLALIWYVSDACCYILYIIMYVADMVYTEPALPVSPLSIHF